MAYFEEEEAPYKIANSGWPERQSCCGQLWKGSLATTMNFTGKYQLQSQENFEPFMKAMGLSEDLIQKGRDIKGISEIVHNGNHVKLTLTYGPKVVHNEFTLGEECELETMSGEKVKAVVKMEGDNKMVTSFKGMKSVTELNGDTITNTMTLGDIVYKRVSKRI